MCASGWASVRLCFRHVFFRRNTCVRVFSCKCVLFFMEGYVMCGKLLAPRTLRSLGFYLKMKKKQYANEVLA